MRARALRRLAAALAGLSAVLVAAQAGAVGLGPARVTSNLGEPLRMSVPLSLQGDEEVGCVAVRGRSDDLPSVPNTRVQVIRDQGQARLEISSGQAVNEPAVGLVVSVGCGAVISRDYVFFLDPPSVAPPPVLATPSAGSGPVPIIRQRTPPIRRESAQPPQSRPKATRPSRSAPAASSSAAPAAPRRAAPIASAPKPRETAPRITAQPALPRLGEPDVLKKPDAPVAAPKRDRLTIAPPDSASAAASAGLPGANPATPPATAPAPTPPAPTSDATAAPNGAAPAIVAPENLPDEVREREEKLRREQAELQQQVRKLNDQIEALRVQATSLATRNQQLEAAAPSSWVIWILVALAIIAILIAGWMTWRYGQLRRSLRGSPWWGANTVHATPPTATAATGDMGAATLAGATVFASRNGPPTRMPTRTDVRSDARAETKAEKRPEAAPSPAPQPAQRSRTREGRYNKAIDTDFTVSDIEAAMATVRTVSPSRTPAAPPALSESDFGALGAHSIPSPFANPPAASISRHEAARLADEAAHHQTDLDIEPIQAGAKPPNDLISSDWKQHAPEPEPAHDGPPLDFKLDIDDAARTDYDPLATNTMTATVVDPDARPQGHGTVDFELPPSTGVAPLTDAHTTGFDAPVRHGATALGDLFASTGAGPAAGPDTILNLDEQDGSPLTTTEVDRLSSTMVNGPLGDNRESPHFRLGRFADLMNQVDESARVDPLQAISHLRQYVLRDENIPTLLWLRLFELYKQVDKRPVYEALADHFARRYHRSMTAWDERLSDRVPQTPLSTMIVIDKEIEESWGTAAGLERLRALLCDRDQPDAIVFNAVLQRDLLDAAKVFPLPQAGAPPRV